MEPEKTVAAVAQDRKAAEMAYRQSLNEVEIRKWCIERTVQVMCSPQGSPAYDELTEYFYDFLTMKGKDNDKAS